MGTERKIGGFRVLNSLAAGAGSQGTVVCAVCESAMRSVPDVKVGDVVALKLMDCGSEESGGREKCERRTRILTALNHPNVVRYFGCFMDEGAFTSSMVVVMEYLKGETLKDRLAANPGGLDADVALMIVRAALSGLAAAEAADVIHRDVKPGNIFICRDGSVKLIDFELSRNAVGSASTSTGMFAGSFDYMAPEFTREAFRGDARSDVFSMGVVLHEALTGQTPYAPVSAGGSANFAFLSRWSDCSSGNGAIRIRPSVRRLLSHADEVLAKALSANPEERYATAAEFLEAIGAIRFRELRNGSKAYRLLRVVGKGGFGEVFKARMRSTGEMVAVKHLLKPAYGDRFRREARVMQQLDDPALVRFVDYFETQHAGGSEAFLVMDFLPGMPGSSLRDAIRRQKGRPLDLRAVFQAFDRYAQALAALHAQGIIHRDVKPSNLYYPEHVPDRAAIMDFGIARDENGTATVGHVPGTLDYMPPEVVLGNNRGDAGMDVYALGLCLYEAMTGQMAYPRLPSGPDALRAFYNRAQSRIAPNFADPEVGKVPGLRDLLLAMTELDPAKRLNDAGEVRRRLAAIAAGRAGSTGVPARQAPVPVVRPSSSVDSDPETCVTTTGGVVEALRRKEFAKRARRTAVAWSLAALCVVAAGGAFLVLNRPRNAEQPVPVPPAIPRVSSESVRSVPASERPAPATNSAVAPVPTVAATNAPIDVKPVVVPAIPAAVPTNATVAVERPKPKSKPVPPAQKPVRVETNAAPVVKAVTPVAKAVVPVITNTAPVRAKAPPAVTTVAPVVPKVAPVVPKIQPVVPKVQPSVPKAAPVVQNVRPAAKPKSQEVIRAEQLVADVKERLAAEPISGRRDRLEKAYALINNWNTSEILASLGTGVEKELRELYKAEFRRVRGIVANDTPFDAEVDTGSGVTKIPAGDRVMVTFDGTWTSERYVKISGYEFVMLPREQVKFEKNTFTVKKAKLVPLPEKVIVPQLGQDERCTIDGEAASGTIELRPGVYEGVYEKSGCQRQPFTLKVEKGQSAQVPRPAKWKPVGTFGSILRGLSSVGSGIADGTKSLVRKASLESDEERLDRENLVIAIELRKRLEQQRSGSR